jgi:hypothetical protein
MSETTHAGGRSFRACIQIESGSGRGRGGIGWFTVGDQGLSIRPWSLIRWWIPERSASKDAVGVISVDQILHVYLPIIRWRRRETVRFENPGCPLSGVMIELRRRARIVDELRAQGYAVMDKRQ